MTYWNKFKSKLLQIWSRHHLTLYLLNAEWNYFYLKQSRGKWVRLPQQLLKIRYDLYLWCHFIIAENCVIILWLGQLYNTCVHSRCHFAGTIISFIMKNCYENIEPICPGRVTSACSNNDTRCVTLVINPVINNEWKRDRIVITTNGSFMYKGAYCHFQHYFSYIVAVSFIKFKYIQITLFIW